MDLVDELRYTYIDGADHGPTVGDMVTFLCGCPELCQKEKTLTMFRLCCLCNNRFPPDLPRVIFGSAISPTSGLKS